MLAGSSLLIFAILTTLVFAASPSTKTDHLSRRRTRRQNVNDPTVSTYCEDVCSYVQDQINACGSLNYPCLCTDTIVLPNRECTNCVVAKLTDPATISKMRQLMQLDYEQKCLDNGFPVGDSQPSVSTTSTTTVVDTPTPSFAASAIITPTSTTPAAVSTMLAASPSIAAVATTTDAIENAYVAPPDVSTDPSPTELVSNSMGQPRVPLDFVLSAILGLSLYILFGN